MLEHDHRMIAEFKRYWKHYVFQSVAATVSIFVVIFAVNIQENPVVIASIGATTFIVFAMPNYLTAQPRNILGGHIVGMVCGFLASIIPLGQLMPDSLAVSILYALAVGASIFIMVVIDTEHPPAAGTALGLAIFGFSLKITLTLLVSMIFLTAVHHFCKQYLRDLT